MTCSGSVAGMAITRAVNDARRRIEKRMVEDECGVDLVGFCR